MVIPRNTARKSGNFSAPLIVVTWWANFRGGFPRSTLTPPTRLYSAGESRFRNFLTSPHRPQGDIIQNDAIAAFRARLAFRLHTASSEHLAPRSNCDIWPPNIRTWDGTWAVLADTASGLISRTAERLPAPMRDADRAEKNRLLHRSESGR